ncbi:MAG: MFS transporter [Elainellaceae cyanobacterium]
MLNRQKSQPQSFIALIENQPNLVPLLVVVTFVMMGIGILAPVLPLYAATFGVNTTLIGMTITLFGVARLCVDIPAGSLIERYGRRRFLWLGPATMAIASYIAALSSSFSVLLVCRFMQGIGSALYMTAAMVTITDLSSPSNRGRTMALYQIALLLGTGLGPTIGGLAARWWGYAAPFWVFGVVASIGAFIALFCLPETLGPKPATTGQRSKPFDLKAIQLLLSQQAFLLIIFVSFATFFTASAAKFGLIPLIGNSRFQMDSDAIGLGLTIAAVANCLILPIAGTMMDRYGYKAVIVPAELVCALTLLLFAWAPTSALFWLGMPLIGMTLGICFPATAAYAVNITRQDQVGQVIGFLRAFSDLGFLLGPLAIGAISDLTPYRYAGGLCFNAALIVVSTIPFLIWAKEHQKQ